MKIALLAVIFSLFVTGCLPNIGTEKELSSKGEFIKGEIVSGFPNLPLHGRAEVIESYGDGANFGASFIVDEDLAKVVSFYGTGLEGLGWEYTLSQRSATNYVFDFKNVEHAGQIIVNTASDGKTTAISVFAEPR